ncbi:MAG: YbaK/EbsC family protein [Pseudomonadota bacterium]
MSKSLKRVRAALDAAGIETEIVEVTKARTAAEAAASLGCKVDQIANSIILLGMESGTVRLFLTSGANRVDMSLASTIAGEPLGKADAAVIRAQTGFAIGGVAPLGHLTPIKAWFDPHLLSFPKIFAAAGTPRHLFAATPTKIMEVAAATPSNFTEIQKM